MEMVKKKKVYNYIMLRGVANNFSQIAQRNATRLAFQTPR
jgi:hypothetical protein